MSDVTWGHTPPRESGHYWYRDLLNNFSPEIFLVDMDTLMAHAFTGHKLDMVLMPGEWYLEPIKAPT